MNELDLFSRGADETEIEHSCRLARFAVDMRRKYEIAQLNAKVISKQEATQIWQGVKERLGLQNDFFIERLARQLWTGPGKRVMLMGAPVLLQLKIKHHSDPTLTTISETEHPLLSLGQNMTEVELRDILSGYGFQCELDDQRRKHEYVILYEAANETIIDYTDISLPPCQFSGCNRCILTSVCAVRCNPYALYVTL